MKYRLKPRIGYFGDLYYAVQSKRWWWPFWFTHYQFFTKAQALRALEHLKQ